MSETGAVETGLDRRARRRLLVILNPAAGTARRRRLTAVVDSLEGLGCQVELRETAGPGDARRLAREAEPGAFDVIVAAGGDGTIAEVLDGLALGEEGRGAGLSGGAAPALGIIPLGTANVLAAELALPSDPLTLSRYLALGPLRRVRFGRLIGGAYFGAMVGAGFDAFVVAGVNLKVKRWVGKAAYGLTALAIWFRPLPVLQVTVDGQAHRAAAVIVSKGRFYAGRFLVAPDARLDDGCLHSCLFQSGGPLRRLVYGLAMAFGRLPSLGDYRVIPGRRVTIEAVGAGPPEAPLQGDGDIIAALPVEIVLGDASVPLVFPPG